MEPSSIDREIIHVDELIRIWKGHYIIDNVVQDQDKAKHYELLPDGRWHVDIKNAEIAGTDDHPDLKIAGLENLLGITFSNCIFKKNFHLRRCHITGWLAFHDVLFEESIDIHTSIIDEDWIIARCRIDSYCNITGDDFRQIRIEDSVFSTFWASSIVVKSDVNFLRTILSGEWLLKDITVGEDFSIINCLQQGKLELYNLQAGLGMNIYSVVITQSLSIIGPGKINGQSFIKQLGVNDITIEAVEFKETLVIEDVCIRRRLQFKDSGLKKVRILGKATSINEIAFEQRTVQTTDIWSVEHIYRIVFDKSILHKESVISFNQCRVKEVAFNSFLNLGNLAFVELEPVHIQFELSMALPDTLRQVVQNIEWQYAEIPLSMPQESKFSIINSDLGKAQFINCGLVTYERFEFVSSRLVDVFLAGTIMPENVQVPLNGPIVYDVQNEQRISYGQLKKNAELRGDAVGAMHFHFKELQAYRKWLVKKGKNRWGERFSLWLNEQSNRHGTNWGRAAAITFLLVVFLYTATCWAYGYRLGNNMSLFFELMSNMPEFLNPIRRTNIFTEISSKPADGNLPLARVIDYLSRFILAYFAYQTIQAFRKYGKKG